MSTQIMGMTLSIEDAQKLMMAELTPKRLCRIEGIPCTHNSIGLPANINDPSNKPITSLESYSRSKEEVKDNNVPWVMRYVRRKHIHSYCLTYDQVYMLNKKLVYIKQEQHDTTTVVSIFETVEPVIDFIHVINTINETCYNDGPD